MGSHLCHSEIVSIHLAHLHSLPMKRLAHLAPLEKVQEWAGSAGLSGRVLLAGLPQARTSQVHQEKGGSPAALGPGILATALSVATHWSGVSVPLPLHLPGGSKCPLTEPNLLHVA